MSPLELIYKKSIRLKKIPDTFLERLKLIQKHQFAIIAAKMKEMELAGEAISPIKANLMLIDEIKEELKQTLLTGEYAEAVKEFVSEFDKQKTLNNQYFDSFKKDYSSEAADIIVNKIKKNTVEYLVKDAIDTKFLLPLDEVLLNAVSSGASFKETLNFIHDFVEGEDVAEKGKILQYAKQVAHDSFANSDRAYGNAIADELEIEWYLYAGDEIDSTRCFCQERHGKYYHYKEIEAWGRGEDVGECGFPWQGMNRATDESTIFTYAGGYNCLHTIAGVSIFAVPKEDVRRNIDNGNYVPSKYEEQEFA